MITIVDYGMGNLGSIRNMLTRIGHESVISADHDQIRRARKLILPGVGSFDAAVENLNARGLVPVLNECVLERRVPILGICLGMQLFSLGSEEGNLPGLGWIEAHTVRFQVDREDAGLRVPHMGWNGIRVQQEGAYLTEGFDAEARFYFVHSYHVHCERAENVLATTEYGVQFHSMVIRDNILGTQFHPEKSHRFGMRLLTNFAGAP